VCRRFLIHELSHQYLAGHNAKDKDENDIFKTFSTGSFELLFTNPTSFFEGLAKLDNYKVLVCLLKNGKFNHEKVSAILSEIDTDYKKATLETLNIRRVEN